MHKKIIISGKELYAKKKSLLKIRIDNFKWMVYYVDEGTNEKWVEEYPDSGMHGGGAPQLKLIEKFPWE